MDFRNLNTNAPSRLLPVFLLSAFLLAGCSSTKLAYRYADWGIVWWVEDYIDLTAAQEQRLNNDIRNFLQWHCSAELPRYRSWLDQLSADLSDGPPDEATVAYHQARLFDFLPALLERATPIAVNLLSSLSDAQVQALADNMKRSQQEMEDKFLAGTPSATANARAERTSERIERWLGDLDENQQQVVNEWSADRGAQTEIWLQGRRNWQQALLDLLEERDSADFPDRLSRLVLDSESVRGDAYAEMMEESRSGMVMLMHDLLQADNTATLPHLRDRTEALNSDFETLSCQADSEVASQAG